MVVATKNEALSQSVVPLHWDGYFWGTILLLLDQEPLKHSHFEVASLLGLRRIPQMLNEGASCHYNGQLAEGIVHWKTLVPSFQVFPFAT